MNYTRVTEVIKPFTGIEFVEESVLENAAERGSKAHRYIEAILNGWEFHVEEPDIEGYLQSFNDFWNRHKHTYEGGSIILENRLNCDKLGITGQPDAIISFPSRTYILDWKTSSRFHKSWHIQGAAYKYLAEQNGYSNVDTVLFVRLDKNGGKAGLHKSESYVENIDIFNKCLELYKFFEMDKTRNKR